MNGEENNDSDQLNLSAGIIKNRVLQRLDRLEKLREERLQPLLEGLQQSEDPRRPERRLEREIDEIENFIMKVNRHACYFKNNEDRLQSQRRAIVQDFISYIELLDDFINGFDSDIIRMEQQSQI